RESFSFESFLMSSNATAAAVAGLGVCWVLLCKNCVAVCGACARRALFYRTVLVNADESYRRPADLACAWVREMEPVATTQVGSVCHWHYCSVCALERRCCRRTATCCLRSAKKRYCQCRRIS